jgi:hypothetical protein
VIVIQRQAVPWHLITTENAFVVNSVHANRLARFARDGSPVPE